MRRNIGAGLGTIVGSMEFESWLTSTKSRRGKVSYRAFEMDQADGRWFWMTESVDPDGWMLCLATDITHLRVGDRALRQAHDLALRASQTDDLTGISSRRSMMSALETLNEDVAQGRVASGCICLLDLDLFKRINDSYGHQIGDRILVAFARLVQTAMRRHDRFGRIGGEEFMLIFPDTDLARAKLIVAGILAKVRKAQPIPDVPLLSYTCSGGITEILPGGSVTDLYARADRALYLAKNAGRDRLEIAA
jgi:diguanylate cyclase (GGDEF)-like protein